MEHITHQGKIIEVVQKEVEHHGVKRIFEFARRSPGVRLIIPKGGQILLTKEHRHEVGGYDYRLPGARSSTRSKNTMPPSIRRVTSPRRQSARR